MEVVGLVQFMIYHHVHIIQIERVFSNTCLLRVRGWLFLVQLLDAVAKSYHSFLF